MTEKRKLIDVRYELASFCGLVEAQLFQEILRKRMELEDRIGDSELLLRLNRRHEKVLEINALRHAVEIEADIPRTQNKVIREEISSAKRAWATAKSEVAKNKGEVSGSTIFKVIQDITGATNYRKCRASISGSSVGVVSPESIEQEMGYVLSAINGQQSKTKGNLSTLEKAFLYHFHIVRIHPFKDGNGRTSRICQNATLCYAGLPSALILQEEKTVYIELLRGALNGFNDRREELEDQILSRTSETKDRTNIRKEYGTEIYLRASEPERLFYDYLASRTNIEAQRLLDQLKNSRR